MAAGDIVEIASWLGGAVVVSAVLDADGLVAEVRRTTTGDATYAGTIVLGGRPFPLAGAMPIPVPKPQRFAPDAALDLAFSGKRA